MILALLASLGALVIVFVLYPVFTTHAAGGLGGLDASGLALSDLHDKKARLLAAIHDLDFEKESGKVSDTDYDTARGDYLAQVASVMEQIDALAPSQAKSKAKAKPKSKPKKKRPEPTNVRACASCGEENPKDSKFCLKCGEGLERSCAQCGEELPATARFCNQCGTKVET